MNNVDFAAEAAPKYAAVYEPFSMPDGGGPKYTKYGLVFDVEGVNAHLPITNISGKDGTKRFNISTTYKPQIKVSGGGWKELKEIVDHLDVCNVPRDKLFRFLSKMVIEGKYLESPRYESTLLVMNRIVFDPRDIDTAGLFE